MILSYDPLNQSETTVQLEEGLFTLQTYLFGVSAYRYEHAENAYGGYYTFTKIQDLGILAVLHDFENMLPHGEGEDTFAYFRKMPLYSLLRVSLEQSWRHRHPNQHASSPDKDHYLIKMKKIFQLYTEMQHASVKG
jgi:hypothetical protein